MKKKKYKHITKTERMEIALLRRKKYSLRNIARMLNRGHNTISREIKENSVRGIYDPEKAHQKSSVRRKQSKYQGMKIVQNLKLWDYVEGKLGEDWSPDEISGRIKNIERDIKYVGFKGIYKFVYSVYGRSLERYLRYRGRKQKGKKRAKVIELKDRTFIDQRPKIVSKRQRFGDWEGDFIASGKQGKGVLIVLKERKAQYSLLRRIISQDTKTVNQCLNEMTEGLVSFNSLTIDNDISFQKHREISELLGCPIYFCHPYHSWEKGSVENTNKLIRQYIPKSSDVSKYSDRYIKEIEDKLNNRPRKCLKYKTPLEVMVENNQFKTLENFGIITKQKNTCQVSYLRG